MYIYTTQGLENVSSFGYEKYLVPISAVIKLDYIHPLLCGWKNVTLYVWRDSDRMEDASAVM